MQSYKDIKVVTLQPPNLAPLLENKIKLKSTKALDILIFLTMVGSFQKWLSTTLESGNSCPCIIPFHQVWSGPSHLFLTNRIKYM